MSFGNGNEVLSGAHTAEQTKTVQQVVEENNLLPQSYEKYKEVKLNSKEQLQLIEGKLSKLQLDQLSGAISSQAESKIKAEQEILISSAKKVAERSKQSTESAESFYEQSMKSVETFSSQVSDSKVGEKVKATIGKVKEAGETVGFGAKLSLLGDKIGGFFGSILKFFAELFSGLKGLLGFGEKAEEIAEKILNPEEREKTINLIQANLEKKFPNKKVEINSLINNPKVREEQLVNISEKIKKGEKIDLKDILNIFPGSKDILFTEIEQQEAVKIAQEKINASIQKEIKSKYNIDLDNKKREKLAQLIKDNAHLDQDNIDTLLLAVENDEYRIKDILGPAFNTAINTSALFVGLITNNIIPASAVGMDFLKDSTQLVKIGVSSLGISQPIDIDIFNKSLDALGEDEKALMIGLLYRKGGLLFGILGSLSETISRTIIESSTNTSVRTLDVLKNSANGNIKGQIDNFEKIIKKIDPENYKNATEPLRRATRNLTGIKENYQILDILANAKGIASDAVSELSKLNISIPSGVNAEDIGDITKYFQGKASINYSEIFDKGSIKSVLGFGADADIYKLNERINHLGKAQKRMFDTNFLGKGYGKLKELFNVAEVSRLGDRLSFHFESVDAAKKGISKWNVLANKFPELAGAFFNKLPIIAVTGLSATSEKPFFEALQKEMLYLLPIVGPVLLISEGGFKGLKSGNIEGVNTLDLAIGGALLTMDGAFLVKEAMAGGINGVARYMVKPILDLYGLARGTAEGAYSIGKAVVNGRSFSLILKESLQKTKGIKGGKIRAIAIASVIGYFGIQAAFGDSEIEEVFSKDGILDKEKLKSIISKLDDSDKETCLQYLLSESYGQKILEGVDISIEDNSINIISHNKEIQSNWIIDGEMLELLNLNNQVMFDYQIS